MLFKKTKIVKFLGQTTIFLMICCLICCFCPFVVQTSQKTYIVLVIFLTTMFGFFNNKKRVDELKIEVQDSFSHVKKDFNKVGDWITHFDDKTKIGQTEMEEIKSQILSIQSDLLEIKDFISFFGPTMSKSMSKQQQTSAVKQTLSEGVQTGVQTEILTTLTVMERAIVWALINAEMKLSYEDLAALLGKDKSTIRGQINAIKQKNMHLIEESREITGKKRLYIPEEKRSMILKSLKVKVQAGKKSEKVKSES